MPSRQPPAFRNQSRPAGWRRMPPFVFVPVLGLFALGLGWREAGEVVAPLAGLGEAILGATSLLWLFAALAYGRKIARRPSVLAEELRTLPGQVGVAALFLGLIMIALVCLRYNSGLALLTGLLALPGLVLVTAVMLRARLFGPEAGRTTSPVWHLVLAGPILLVQVLAASGFASAAWAVLGLVGAAAAFLWLNGIGQLLRQVPPPPLRPLLTLHLSSAAALTLAAAALEAAQGLRIALVLDAVMLGAILLASHWLLASGHGVFRAVAGYAAAITALGLLAAGQEIPGLLLLAMASAAVPILALRAVQGWMRGSLGAETNAATA